METSQLHGDTQHPLSDDSILPFEIKPLGVRGRVVRLGPMIDEILSKHDYPDNVSARLAEAVALVAMLGNSLKFEGKLTLQTRSDGPLSMLVVDYTTPGKMRGYAHFDREAVEGISENSALIGKGHLALTIDQGENTENYQGIVALEGAKNTQVLADAAHNYFRQSEQIPTRLKLAAGSIMTETGTSWRAGAIMVQHVPDNGPVSPIEVSAGDKPEGPEEPEGFVEELAEDDNWTKARLLLETTEIHELLDPTLAPERLLFRLFHEDGVTVYSPAGLEHLCSCSKARVLNMLASFSEAERADMVVDGQVEVVCQFCSNTHRFKPQDL